MSVKAVLLDFDGTLLDSERVYFRLWNTVLAVHGRKISERQYGEILLGHPNYKNAEDLVALFGLDGPAHELVRHVEQLMQAYFGRRVPPLTPRADEAVRRLHSRGCRLAVISSNTRPFIERGLQMHNLSPFFETVVARDDVADKKPHPEPYLEAMRRLKVEADHCVAVEDTVPGLQSACAAGLRCLQFSGTFEQRHEIDGVVGSIRELGQVSDWV